MLADRGAIFVSIDDNEAAYLRLLMDEVFGEANFLAQVVVNLNPKGGSWGRFATSTSTCWSTPRTPGSGPRREQPGPVDQRDFPLDDPDGRRYRHLPLRNTNKKFNPATARTLHFPVYGDPDAAWCDRPFEGSHEIAPVFGDGTPAVWRWTAPLIDERPTTWSAAGSRAARRARRRLPEGLAAPDGRPTQEAADHLAGRGGRLHRHCGRRAQGGGRPRLRVAEADGAGPPDPETMPDDVLVLDFFAGSGTTGHAVALAERGGRRRPALHQRQLRRADP